MLPKNEFKNYKMRSLEEEEEKEYYPLIESSYSTTKNSYDS
jgi:hypothetical protein